MARPKGSKNKQSTGLPFNKRMRVLTSIILDDTQKTCDRLTAIKAMTDLLNDKVKESTEGATETILKFENTVNTEQNKVKQPEIKPELPSIKADEPLTHVEKTTTTTTTQPPAQEEVKNNNELKFTFVIDKDK